MIPFGEIVLSPLGHALRFLMTVLLLGQLGACVSAAAHRRRPLYTALTLAHLTAFFALFLILIDGTYFPLHLPERTVFPAAVVFAYRLPWAVYALVICASAGCLAACFVGDARFAKARPSIDSVKEAVDSLPVGVCFVAENGTVALMNLKMNEWCIALTGQPLSDGNAFVSAVYAAAGARGEMLVRLPEGGVLLFSESELRADGKTYRQFTAADVTARFAVTAELEAKNARLRDIQLRMKTYSVELADLVLKKELLAARVTIHDSLGHVLLRSKYYLEHPESTDEAALLELLLQTNDLFLGGAEDMEGEPQAPFEEALRLASGVGVKVSLEGAPPENAAVLKLLGQALRECAVNAGKQAGGNALRLTCVENPRNHVFTLRTNGAPAGEVEESGGLRSLRQAVEGAGGTLLVQPLEEFTVTLILPKP